MKMSQRFFCCCFPMDPLVLATTKAGIGCFCGSKCAECRELGEKNGWEPEEFFHKSFGQRCFFFGGGLEILLSGNKNG